MRLGSCPREQDLNLVLNRGHWPQACSDELRAHVAGCPSCRELVVVREAFGRERMMAAGEPRLESPGVLWWRAQLRRRNTAIQRIGRPLLGAQIFAWAVCLAAAVAYVLWQTRRGFDWLAWLAELPRALRLDALVPSSWGNSPWEIWLGISMVVMLAFMGGVVVYLARNDRDQESGIRGR
ncbi:MAG TPA: hypothetical protein VGL00_09785 [Terracidiphilus sp.]